MTFFSVNNLSVIYETSKGPVYAVDGASFDLKEGESIGIAGESACGKSTLGLAMLRMLFGGKITNGDIVFDDEKILEVNEHEFAQDFRWKKISMIFQGAMNSLDPVFTIKEQFIEVLKQHNYDGDSKTLISDAIKSVNLDSSVLQKYPHELSGGMKQRVVIAMALLLKPKLVIADEPTTALDVLIQAQIINLLKKLKKNGMSFLFITHDLAILSEIADKVGIMYGGQMIEFGSADEIYNNPKHPYTKLLLESIPKLHGSKPTYIKGVPPSLQEPPTECRFIDRCPDAFDKCKKNPANFKTNSGYVQCWLYENTETD